MTILKKINALSIALIAATIIGVGLDAGFKWYDYGRSFRDGFSAGYTEARGDYRSDNANGSTTLGVSQDGNKKTTFLEFLSAIGLIALCITIAVAFFRLVINYIGVLGTVKRGDVFSEDLEWRTNHIGIGLIVIYIAEWALTFILDLEARDCPSFGVLCCGIGLMIVSQIFVLGRKMKEDQEYTV